VEAFTEQRDPVTHQIGDLEVNDPVGFAQCSQAVTPDVQGKPSSRCNNHSLLAETVENNTYNRSLTNERV
jgi:hypothetical protein